LNLSSISKQIIAAYIGHNIDIDEPKVVSKTIKEIIDSLEYSNYTIKQVDWINYSTDLVNYDERKNSNKWIK